MSYEIDYDLLDSRTANVLKNANITTYQQLCSYTIPELKKFRNVGRQTIYNLLNHLHGKNLKLRKEDDEYEPLKMLEIDLQLRISHLEDEMKELFRILKKSYFYLKKLEDHNNGINKNETT